MALQYITRAVVLNCPQSSQVAEPYCVSRIEQALYAAFGSLQYEYVRFTCLLKDVAGNGDFSHSFSFNFSNFPAVWDMEYEAGQYYLHDPLVVALDKAKHAPLVYGTWQEAYDAGDAETLRAGQEQMRVKYRELMAAVSRHGINGGLYMMLNTGQRRLVISCGTARDAVSVASQVSDGEVYQQVFSILALLNQLLGMSSNCSKCATSMRVAGGEPVKLTPKQAMILEAFADRPTANNADVARINAVSVETVAFHLKSIRKKFRQPSASGHALANIAKSHGLL